MIDGELANIARIAVIFFGGFVIGMGVVVLLERARHYGREGIRDGQRAMWSLIIVNAFTLAYISSVLIGRWGHVLSWRTPLALMVFVAKAYFFHTLHRVGIEQERRILWDSRL